ncbi:mitochondrial carrier protein-like protein [Polychaeton citri CBS 116435]|uniref:Mitochondrial carrier protein-like protein n=1 Tax=Polychaeton citri CBS 116435 TaxID=1314669 RepID=A0A9P4UMB1_9PEZI|nr:mitochondrial carrier protein-like protein [Polychaeton citri CBS 116435]
MSADFWAGYLSGAVGILVGNPLDIIKTRLQAGSDRPSSRASSPATAPISSASASTPADTLPERRRWTSFARGSAAPILGYGALNALLFVTYNRSLALFNTSDVNTGPSKPSIWSLWTAGALGGLATFFVSAPTELVKCRAQVSSEPAISSLQVARDLWAKGRVRGLYLGGGVTSARDAVGYGFYFLSYELSKDAVCRDNDSSHEHAFKILMCGGLAGIITWASIFPLDVIKTRVQTWDLVHAHKPTPNGSEQQPLISITHPSTKRPSVLAIAKHTYQTEGLMVFFRGLGVCSARAFIVNAVQWAVSILPPD